MVRVRIFHCFAGLSLLVFCCIGCGSAEVEKTLDDYPEVVYEPDEPNPTLLKEFERLLSPPAALNQPRSDTFIDCLFVDELTTRALAAGEAGPDIDERLAKLSPPPPSENRYAADGLLDRLVESQQEGKLSPVEKELYAQLMRGLDPNHPKEKLSKITLAIHGLYLRDRAYPRVSPNGENGLGWRVYVLPELGHGDLYKKFNLQEPWDSPTNKPLIAEMPAVFQTEGVEPGKTVFHAFLGEGTPMGSKERQRLSGGMQQAVELMERAGRVNTGLSADFVLLVMAGPEQAVEWTRPGGIPFNKDAPFDQVGETGLNGYPVIMAGGELRLISKNIKPEDALKFLTQGPLPENAEQWLRRWPQ